MNLLPKNPETMWVFDVDGVLTNPEQKKIVYPELVAELVRRITKGEPVALNSGRACSFLEQEILLPLQQKLPDQNLLNLVFPVGEYGGVWITTTNGVFERHSNPSVQPPKTLQEQIRQCIHEHATSVLFFDEDKQTMISLELQKGKRVEDFQAVAPQICTCIQNLLDQLHLQHEWMIDVTRISIDVRSIEFDKKRGIMQIFALLKKAQIEPERFISFGDSPSDYAMHTALRQTGKPAQFVFVGEPDLIKGNNLKGCEFPARRYDEGTLEYLKNH